MNDDELIERLLQGQVAPASRLITRIENRAEDAVPMIKRIFPHTGRAHVIGVTGSPGVGKSVLTCGIAQAYRDAGKQVGVVAVDPSSRFSGGAILGDRLRFERGDLDDVFIRSMATRGKLGGLCAAAWDAVNVMDAMGKEVILVETVGVGQNEMDILEVAHTTLLVLSPGLGDEIQALKSGVMEIADLFVVNKCDLAGADKTCAEVQGMLALGEQRDWAPEIFRTVALKGEGVPGLIEGIERHRAHLGARGRLGGNNYSENQLLGLLKERFLERFLGGGDGRQAVQRSLEQVRKRETDPYTAVDDMLDALWSGRVGEPA